MSEANEERQGERLSSRGVFAGRVIEVTVDRVRLPNGRETDMERVHFAGAAGVLPIVDGADGPRVVLVRQYRYCVGGWIYEIPAGKLDRPDEEPADCARRELAEETGYEAGELVPLGGVWSTPGATDEKVWLFAATGLAEPAAGALDDDEVLAVVHLPLAAAVRMAVEGEIDDAKTVCALLRWGCSNLPPPQDAVPARGA